MRRPETLKYLFDIQEGCRLLDEFTSGKTLVDYESEADLAAKFLVGNRLGPVVAAIFANSPLEAGTLSGFKSRRYAAWLETDRDRTGVSRRDQWAASCVAD